MVLVVEVAAHCAVTVYRYAHHFFCTGTLIIFLRAVQALVPNQSHVGKRRGERWERSDGQVAARHLWVEGGGSSPAVGGTSAAPGAEHLWQAAASAGAAAPASQWVGRLQGSACNRQKAKTLLGCGGTLLEVCQQLSQRYLPATALHRPPPGCLPSTRPPRPAPPGSGAAESAVGAKPPAMRQQLHHRCAAGQMRRRRGRSRRQASGSAHALCRSWAPVSGASSEHHANSIPTLLYADLPVINVCNQPFGS